MVPIGMLNQRSTDHFTGVSVSYQWPSRTPAGLLVRDFRALILCFTSTELPRESLPPSSSRRIVWDRSP